MCYCSKNITLQKTPRACNKQLFYQSVGNISAFINAFKQVAINMFFQSWTCTLNNSSRYCLYREFKSILAPEKYLSNIIDKRLRIMLVKFRCGLLRLKYNEGRWLGIDKEQRLCTFCNLGVEDEYHFLFICPLYSNLRSKYLPVMYHNNANIHKFSSILSSESLYIMTGLSKFIYHAYKLRESQCRT